MDTIIKSGVIVLGGHVQGLGIIRTYGMHGLPVILIDNTRYNIARFSKYCKKYFYFKKGHLLEFLEFLGENREFNSWLIVPTNDYHVKVLSQNYEKLSKYFKISTDRWESINQCYNKTLTYKKAKELNILIPQTFFPVGENELKNLEIIYPCIIKPAIMHEFYSKLKKKVFVCNSNDELIHYYNKALEIIPAEQIIIQEIIPGTSENQFSACFFFENKKVISTLTAKRKRQHPLDFGNATTFAEIVNQSELSEIAQRLLSNINYNGICEVEFKRHEKDGKFYFLEINPRSWKWHSIAQKSNIHFLLNLYNYHNNLPYISDSPPDYAICWQHIATDIPTLIKQFFKGQYHKSKCTRKQYAVYDTKDILPFIVELLLLPILILKR